MVLMKKTKVVPHVDSALIKRYTHLVPPTLTVRDRQLCAFEETIWTDGVSETRSTPLVLIARRS